MGRHGSRHICHHFNEKINKNLELGAGGKKEPRDSRQKALLISSRSGPKVNDAPCGRGDGAD